MPTLIEATERLRAKYEAQFQFYSTAYYYCNHSKKRDRLRKKMTEAYRRMEFWEERVADWEKRGLKR